MSEIDSDDWRLKPEQHPSETREEWKHRTFAMHYGRREGFADIEMPKTLTPEEAASAMRQFEASFARFPKVVQELETGEEGEE